jgi:hypothetical protein
MTRSVGMANVGVGKSRKCFNDHNVKLVGESASADFVAAESQETLHRPSK